MKNEKEGGWKECGASLHAAPPAAFLASACQFGFAIRSCVIEVSDRRFCPGLHETCSGGGRTWPSPGGSSAQGAVLAAARSPGTESRNQSNSICISSLHCIGYLISAPMAKLAD